VENGGVVGRGVLLDYAAWAEAENLQFDPFSTHAISAKILREIAASQGTELKQGDILFIRSGWVRAYSQLSEAQAKALADITSPPAVGIESSEQTLRWLWETGFAAVAGDMPSMEAWPCQNTQFWLHEWLLAGWGMPIGELFDLERLSEECRRQGRWSFFFSSVPLRVSKILRSISSPMFQVDDSSRYQEEWPAHLTGWQFCSSFVYR
jgi:kynurenine formamidase